MDPQKTKIELKADKVVELEYDKNYFIIVKGQLPLSTLQGLQKLVKEDSMKNIKVILLPPEGVNVSIESIKNPLKEVVQMPDEIYDQLVKNNLLNDKVIRNFEIHSKYREMRKQEISGKRMKADFIIEMLANEYHLGFDSIKQIATNKKYNIEEK